jgi:hypothetical protein
VSATQIDLSFPHRWRAQILPARPAILPARHFTYPNDAEEVERGALEVLVHPEPNEPGAPGLDSETGERAPGAPRPDSRTWESSSTERVSQISQPFLATCALGFKDPAVPTGIWSTPNPDELCAVSGGYAYLIHTTAPERFTMLPYRPVLRVRPALENNLLLFVGHHAILAWAAEGEAWQSPRLSDEGVSVTSIEAGVLHGLGWSLISDKENPFALNLCTGTLCSLRR